MKLQDLFEAKDTPEAHSLKEFAILATKSSDINYEGTYWFTCGPAGTRSWKFLVFTAPWEDRHVHIEIYQDTPYYIQEKEGEVITSQLILDPELFIRASFVSLMHFKPLTKDILIKEFLVLYKNDIDDEQDKKHLINLIKAAKMLGYDGPEFRAIEKSLKAGKNEL
jgi:hypothetical protein